MLAASGNSESLCGMASLYRTLVNSVMTKSQLKKMTYSMMKEKLINMTVHFSTYVYTQYDDWKDNLKSKDKLLLKKIYMVLCENPPVVSGRAQFFSTEWQTISNLQNGLQNLIECAFKSLQSPHFLQYF